MRQIWTIAIAPVIAITLVACEPKEPAQPAAALSADATGPLPLEISINELMVALVDFAADGIWRPAAQDLPMTDSQWLLAEQDALNLVASATLMTTAGTGVNDSGWVQDPDWRRWSIEVQKTAQQAKVAIDARDQARLLLIGDRLVELCQTCHQKFKPGLPSMGVTRFPIYPKRDGQ